MRRSAATAVPATPLATCLIVAEFDIDTGACLRACYPPRPASSPSASTAPASSAVEAAAPPGIAGYTEYFANVMLPDGAEKVSVTRTVFVVNRPQPPVLLRFPVYRFLRAAAAGSAPGTNTAATAGTGAGGAASAVARWERHPGEDTALYVPEMLMINSDTEEVSLRYKDSEVEAPRMVPMESISSLPSIPHEVVRFSRQLEAMLMNEATLAGSHTTSFAAASAGGDTTVTDSAAAHLSLGSSRPGGTGGGGGGGACGAGTASASASPGLGGGGGGTGDYAFVVVDYPASASAVAAAPRQEGYLMKIAVFERLLKTLTTLLQREKPAPSSSEVYTEGAAGSAADGASGGVETLDGPLDVPGASAAAAVASPVSPRRTGASSFGDVDVEGRYGDGSDRVSPASSVPRFRPAADTDTATLTNSMEPSGHLVLPGTEPSATESDGEDGAANFEPGGGAGRYVDPTAVGGVSASGMSVASAAAAARARQRDAATGPVLFGLCAVVSKRDSTARRGGITKSVAVLGPSLVWLEPFFPILVAAAQYSCDVSGTEESALRQLQRILKRCYDSMNNAAGMVAAGRAKVDQLTAEIGKHCTLGSGQQAYVYYTDAPFNTTVKAKIPLSPESNDIVFTRYSLETIIEVLGPSFLHLLLGILTEKKILILSRQGDAADVCEVALSLGIIGNLLDRNFMAQKVFPYVSVSSVDHFMQVPGYVVGTLNPIFDNVNPWGWDLMCDLDGKAVITAAERLQRKTTGTSSTSAGNWSAATAGLANAVGVGGGNSDAEALRAYPAPLQQLYKQLVNMIYHLRALRIGAIERNRRLRLMLEDFLYTVVLVGYVSGGSVAVPNALYPTFAHRSLGVLRSEMVLTSMMDSVRSHVLHPGENPALLLCCAALRHCACGETPVQRTLQALLAMLNTAYEVKLFLRRMALAVGGLNAVGMQLTSPSAEAREAAAALLARVESVPEGKAAIASMNNFFLMIYENSVATSSR